MAAFPPDVRPETGPKKELAPQFRRTLVDYPTKEPAGTIIIDTPNTYLYLVLGNGKALRYGVGVGREGFTWSGVQQVTRMAEWPDWNPPGNDRAPALSAALHGRRRDEPARRARSLSRQDGVSHPRHQSALDHRHLRVFGMHPANQRTRHGSLYPGQGRHARGGAARQAAGDGGRDAACIGVTQRWVSNDCAARSASLRDGAVNIQPFHLLPH